MGGGINTKLVVIVKVAAIGAAYGGYLATVGFAEAWLLTAAVVCTVGGSIAADFAIFMVSCFFTNPDSAKDGRDLPSDSPDALGKTLRRRLGKAKKKAEKARKQMIAARADREGFLAAGTIGRPFRIGGSRFQILVEICVTLGVLALALGIDTMLYAGKHANEVADSAAYVSNCVRVVVIVWNAIVRAFEVAQPAWNWAWFVFRRLLFFGRMCIVNLVFNLLGNTVSPPSMPQAGAGCGDESAGSALQNLLNGVTMECMFPTSDMDDIAAIGLGGIAITRPDTDTGAITGCSPQLSEEACLQVYALRDPSTSSPCPAWAIDGSDGQYTCCATMCVLLDRQNEPGRRLHTTGARDRSDYDLAQAVYIYTREHFHSILYRKHEHSDLFWDVFWGHENWVPGHSFVGDSLHEHYTSEHYTSNKSNTTNVFRHNYDPIRSLRVVRPRRALDIIMDIYGEHVDKAQQEIEAEVAEVMWGSASFVSSFFQGMADFVAKVIAVVMAFFGGIADGLFVLLHVLEGWISSESFLADMGAVIEVVSVVFNDTMLDVIQGIIDVIMAAIKGVMCAIEALSFGMINIGDDEGLGVTCTIGGIAEAAMQAAADALTCGLVQSRCAVCKTVHPQAVVFPPDTEDIPDDFRTLHFLENRHHYSTQNNIFNAPDEAVKKTYEHRLFDMQSNNATCAWLMVHGFCEGSIIQAARQYEAAKMECDERQATDDGVGPDVDCTTHPTFPDKRDGGFTVEETPTHGIYDLTPLGTFTEAVGESVATKCIAECDDGGGCTCEDAPEATLSNRPYKVGANSTDNGGVISCWELNDKLAENLFPAKDGEAGNVLARARDKGRSMCDPDNVLLLWDPLTGDNQWANHPHMRTPVGPASPLWEYYQARQRCKITCGTCRSIVKKSRLDMHRAMALWPRKWQVGEMPDVDDDNGTWWGVDLHETHQPSLWNELKKDVPLVDRKARYNALTPDQVADGNICVGDYPYSTGTGEEPKDKVQCGVGHDSLGVRWAGEVARLGDCWRLASYCGPFNKNTNAVELRGDERPTGKFPRRNELTAESDGNGFTDTFGEDDIYFSWFYSNPKVGGTHAGLRENWESMDKMWARGVEGRTDGIFHHLSRNMVWAACPNTCQKRLDERNRAARETSWWAAAWQAYTALEDGSGLFGTKPSNAFASMPEMWQRRDWQNIREPPANRRLEEAWEGSDRWNRHMEEVLANRGTSPWGADLRRRRALEEPYGGVLHNFSIYNALTGNNTNSTHQLGNRALPLKNSTRMHNTGAHFTTREHKATKIGIAGIKKVNAALRTTLSKPLARNRSLHSALRYKAEHARAADMHAHGEGATRRRASVATPADMKAVTSLAAENGLGVAATVVLQREKGVVEVDLTFNDLKAVFEKHVYFYRHHSADHHRAIELQRKHVRKELQQETVHPINTSAPPPRDLGHLLHMHIVQPVQEDGGKPPRRRAAMIPTAAADIPIRMGQECQDTSWFGRTYDSFASTMDGLGDVFAGGETPAPTINGCCLTPDTPAYFCGDTYNQRNDRPVSLAGIIDYILHNTFLCYFYADPMHMCMPAIDFDLAQLQPNHTIAAVSVFKLFPNPADAGGCGAWSDFLSPDTGFLSSVKTFFAKQSSGQASRAMFCIYVRRAALFAVCFMFVWFGHLFFRVCKATGVSLPCCS